MRPKEFWQAKHIRLDGGVDTKLVEEFDKQVISIAEDARKEEASWPKTTVVLLTTNGGDVSDGRAIFDKLRLLNRQTKLYIVAFGKSNSMGVPLMMSVPVEQRLMTPSSTLFIHQVQSSMSEIHRINIESKELRVRELLVGHRFSHQQAKWVYSTIARGSCNSLEQIEQWCLYGKFLTPRQAIKLGFAGGMLRV